MRKFSNKYFEAGLLKQFLMTVIPQSVMVFELISAAIFLGFGYGSMKLIGLVFVALFIVQRFYRFRSIPRIDDVLKNNEDLSLCVSQKTLNDIKASYHRAVLSDVDFELDFSDRSLSDKETQMMFYRLGIDPLEIEEKILARLSDEVIGIKEDIFSNILALSEYAAKVALKTGGGQIKSADFLIASVLLGHDELTRIMRAFRVTPFEMQEALLLERSRNRNLIRNFINNLKNGAYRLFGKKFEINSVIPGTVNFFDDETLYSVLDVLGKGKPVFILEHYKTESLEFVEQIASLISYKKYFLGHKIILGENIIKRKKIGKFINREDIYFFKDFDLIKNQATIALVKDVLEDGAGIIIALTPNEINRAEREFGGASIIKLPKLKDEELAMILAQRAAFMEGKGLRMTVSAMEEIMNVLKRYFSGSLLAYEQIINEAFVQAGRGDNKVLLSGDILKAAERLYREELPTGIGAFKKEVAESLFEVGMMRKVSEEAAFYLLQYRARLWHEAVPISFFTFSEDNNYCEKVKKICLSSVLGTNWSKDQVMEIDGLQYKDSQNMESLIGSEDQKVYGKLAEFVDENPRAVIVIKNFSQGSSFFIKMFYQMIKEGWIKDGKGNLIDATQLLILIFDCGISSDNSILDHQKFLVTIGNKK